MDTYEKPYFLLFNAITDATTQLMRCQNIDALKTLLGAQREAEELILSEEEWCKKETTSWSLFCAAAADGRTCRAAGCYFGRGVVQCNCIIGE